MTTETDEVKDAIIRTISERGSAVVDGWAALEMIAERIEIRGVEIEPVRNSAANGRCGAMYRSRSTTLTMKSSGT